MNLTENGSCSASAASGSGSVASSLASTDSESANNRRNRRKAFDDENLSLAIEAVSKGMGFCRASKVYNVNNRSLWLEYKKLGLPSSRHRKSE